MILATLFSTNEYHENHTSRLSRLAVF